MTNITRLPSLPHVAKAIRPTVDGTVQALLDLDEGQPPFSYNLSWKLAFMLYSGALSLDAALAACKKLRTPLVQNVMQRLLRLFGVRPRRRNFFAII